MNNRKEKRPLQRALCGSESLSATHAKQDSTQIVNTLSLDSVRQPPPSVDGHLVPVARYELSEEGRLSSYCICYDIRDEGPYPSWLNIHIDDIPPIWLSGLPVVGLIDQDLLLDPVLVATLEKLKKLGWLKPIQEIIAWASGRGNPQAEYWAAVYAEKNCGRAIYVDAH